MFNLIVVNKLIADNKCSISFNNDGCFVQEVLKKKSWLLGKPKNGLYVLKDEGFGVNGRMSSMDRMQKNTCDTDTITAVVFSDSLVNKAKYDI